MIYFYITSPYHRSYQRWPISCKFGSVRCAEWMPSTLRSRCGNSIILVVGGVNGLELISLYKAHRKPLRCVVGANNPLILLFE